MLTADEDQTLDENSGDLYVVPDGGGLPPQSLKDEVLRFIREEHPPFTTFTLRVQDPVYLPVDLEAYVFFERSLTEADRRRVAGEIAASVGAFFARAMDPGSGAAPVAESAPEAEAEEESSEKERERIGFGFHVGGGGPGEIAWSSIFDVVRDAHGVLKLGPDGLLLNGSAADVPLTVRDFPVLGTIRIVDAEAGVEVFSG